MTAPHWTKTPTGYSLTGGPVPATLEKTGSRWTLHTLGRSVDLGRRASLDRAEAQLMRLVSAH